MPLLRDKEAQATSEQEDGHDRKSEEQERSPSVRVDGEQGGEGKDEVDRSETEGSVERLTRTEPVLGEDGTRVKCDDVDTAHLLSEHNGESSPSCSLDTGNDEQFLQSSEEAVSLENLGFFIELSADVVEISRSLERGESQSEERLVSLGVSTFLQEPTRGFCREIE